MPASTLHSTPSSNGFNGKNNNSSSLKNNEAGANTGRKKRVVIGPGRLMSRDFAGRSGEGGSLAQDGEHAKLLDEAAYTHTGKVFSYPV